MLEHFTWIHYFCNVFDKILTFTAILWRIHCMSGYVPWLFLSSFIFQYLIVFYRMSIIMCASSKHLLFEKWAWFRPFRRNISVCWIRTPNNPGWEMSGHKCCIDPKKGRGPSPLGENSIFARFFFVFFVRHACRPKYPPQYTFLRKTKICPSMAHVTIMSPHHRLGHVIKKYLRK